MKALLIGIGIGIGIVAGVSVFGTAPVEEGNVHIDIPPIVESYTRDVAKAGIGYICNAATEEISNEQ